MEYYRDDLDAGDDPLVAGCHMSYSNSECTEDAAFHAGDKCEADGNTLIEWTNTNCHSATDKKPYKCDKHCQSLGHVTGECKNTHESACGGKGSAFCKCTGGS
jgi:hypothetical protein